MTDLNDVTNSQGKLSIPHADAVLQLKEILPIAHVDDNGMAHLPAGAYEQWMELTRELLDIAKLAAEALPGALEALQDHWECHGYDVDYGLDACMECFKEMRAEGYVPGTSCALGFSLVTILTRLAALQPLKN